jgi:hypothetical protein
MYETPMIDAVDRELLEWLQGAAPKTAVSLAAPPAAAPEQPAVSCYLLELAAAPPARGMSGAGRAPLQLALRYLVSVSAASPVEAHRVFGPLVFAALEREGCEVRLDAPPPALWQALGVIPRPAFTLQVPLRQQRPEPAAGIVLHPIVINEAPLRALAGRVLGPGAVPLAGARLELPALHLATRSDHQGRFSFPPIPSAPLPGELVVSARGRVLRVVPDQVVGADHRLTITFPIPEN